MKDLNYEFEKYRPYLLSLSYKYLGTFSEAEEIVQDVAIEFLKKDLSSIENIKGWLIRVCTNKSIDALRKAYKKRELYPGVWLPEFLPETHIFWDTDLEKKEFSKISFLILLENLSPKERVIYVLRVVFDYSFKEVSLIMEITDSNARKIFQRANKKIERNEGSNDSFEDIEFDKLKHFFDLASSGAHEEIVKLLNMDSEFWSDGGGKASAPRKVISNPSVIAQFFAKIFSDLSRSSDDYKIKFVKVNMNYGAIVSRKNAEQLFEVETIFSFEFLDKKITRIYAQRNPTKLAYLIK